MEIVAALHCFVQVLARTEAEATALTGRECCSTDDVLRYLDSKQPNANDCRISKHRDDCAEISMSDGGALSNPLQKVVK